MHETRDNLIKQNKPDLEKQILHFFSCEGCSFKFVCVYLHMNICGCMWVMKKKGDHEREGRDLKGRRLTEEVVECK